MKTKTDMDRSGRDTPLSPTCQQMKAVSPLRFATAIHDAYGSPKARIYLASLLLCAFALNSSLFAATNDLTSQLQKGLFEEEANHNLEAAAQAYQNVSAQFDKDRKLAATAIFRLGEVYRKQGKTNEATAQFERIVREFSDQSTLATLSQQNLTALRPQIAQPAPATVLTINTSPGLAAFK